MSSFENISVCDVCQKSAQQKCGGCHLIFYCGKEHQKLAWKEHKKNCKPFIICKDETLGRYLIASKTIKSGDVVLQEQPLIWGPSEVTMPVCLGCGKLISAKNSKPCSKCGWPMCSEICEKAPCHIPECRFTAQKGDKVEIKNFGIVHPSYQCILVLRCLYQKQFLPEIWKKLEKLESHCEKRKGTPKYENEKVSISEFIRRFFKLEHAFYESEIMKVCGIVMVNGHEVPLTDPPYVALYEKTSLFEHSCSANCTKSFTDDGRILITAGQNIEKGAHLSICYTDPLWGTPNRRHHLNETKFFWCSCPRCLDVTEFGTFFSAMKCQNSPCKGFLLPETFQENSFNEKSLDWACNKCSTNLSTYKAHDILEKLGQDLSLLEKGESSQCKAFLKSAEPYLHPNHYYLTDVKLALSQLLGQEFDGGLPALSDEDLELKIKLCQGLDSLANRLVPAEKRIRGLVLFELHASLAELGRRKATIHGENDQLHLCLTEAKKFLEESIDLLKNEPSVLPEGKICAQAKLNLRNINIVLQTVHQTLAVLPI